MFLNVGTGPYGAGYSFSLSGAFPGVELTHESVSLTGIRL